MMKVGGIWCSPFEIEARLVEHPKVLEAAVVGREDDSGLIKPEAHVVLNNSDEEFESVSLNCKNIVNLALLLINTLGGLTSQKNFQNCHRKDTAV